MPDTAKRFGGRRLSGTTAGSSNPDDTGPTGGPVLDLHDDSDVEGPPPECAIEGCSRDGAAARKIRPPGSDDDPHEQFVCRYHYSLFIGVRVLVGLVVIAVFVATFIGI